MERKLRLLCGEELRGELFLVRNSISKSPLGKLIQNTTSLMTYRDRCEINEQTIKNPDYQCVRELLTDTIEKLAEELNNREKKYLGLQQKFKD